MAAGDAARRFPPPPGGFPVLPYNDPPNPIGPPPPDFGIPEGGPVRAIPPSPGLVDAAGKMAAEEAQGDRKLCLPMLGLHGWERGPLCFYWSDVVIYAAAVGMILLGALAMLRR